jgi:hypothetical protein
MKKIPAEYFLHVKKEAGPAVNIDEMIQVSILRSQNQQ